MKLGAYTACLHDRPLDEALEILAGLGLTSAEINAGGFIRPRTCRPVSCCPVSCSRRITWPGSRPTGSR